MEKNKIITETDCNGYGKKRVTEKINAGYKVSSSATKVDNSGGYYTVYTLVKKNWLERLLNL